VVSAVLLYAGAALALVLAWINGANNAGNVIGAAVGARSISAKRALQLAFLFEIAGATLLGHYVSATITRGIINPAELSGEKLLAGVLVIAASATLWMFIATYLRVPLSVTQATIGSVVGFGLVVLGFHKLNWSVLASILFSWPSTLLLAIFLSIVLYRLYTTALSRARETKRLLVLSSALLYVCAVAVLLVLVSSVGDILATLASLLAPIPATVLYAAVLEKRVPGSLHEARYAVNRHLLLVSTSLAALSHGAHDVGASAGLLQLVVSEVGAGGALDARTSRLVLFASGLVMALGMLRWGYRVLGTLAERITPLTPEAGFAAQLSTALTMLLVTRMGLPSSTTLAITGAIIGVGLARGRGYVNTKTVIRVFAMWVVGFPATLLLSMAMSALVPR